MSVSSAATLRDVASARVGLHDEAGVVSEGVTRGRKMHMARPTAGQSVLDRTGNLKAVQKLLGHSSLVTGDIYTDWDIDQLEETMRYVTDRGRIWREKSEPQDDS
jgi:site-specific recombinase XerC